MTFFLEIVNPVLENFNCNSPEDKINSKLDSDASSRRKFKIFSEKNHPMIN